MNIYRNKKTGVVLEIASEFGNSEVWEKISPAPSVKPVKAEPAKEAEPKKAVKKTVAAPKKATTTKKAVKK